MQEKFYKILVNILRLLFLLLPKRYMVTLLLINWIHKINMFLLEYLETIVFYIKIFSLRI